MVNPDSIDLVKGQDWLTDLTFHCLDGSIQAHQIVLASHSRFLKHLFLAQHSFEFSIIDWRRSIAQLTGRRASPMIELQLPDFSKEEMTRVLTCLYSGQLCIESEEQSATLKTLWKSLRIESFKLSDLDFQETDELENGEHRNKIKLSLIGDDEDSIESKSLMEGYESLETRPSTSKKVEEIENLAMPGHHKDSSSPEDPGEPVEHTDLEEGDSEDSDISPTKTKNTQLIEESGDSDFDVPKSVKKESTDEENKDLDPKLLTPRVSLKSLKSTKRRKILSDSSDEEIEDKKPIKEESEKSEESDDYKSKVTVSRKITKRRRLKYDSSSDEDSDYMKPFKNETDSEDSDNKLSISRKLAKKSHLKTSDSSSEEDTKPQKPFVLPLNEINQGRLLWDFLQVLLTDPQQRYLHLITWRDMNKGIFRIVNPSGLAKLWGIQKNSPSMNYEKLSRALRYYYKDNILQKFVGEHYCYQ